MSHVDEITCLLYLEGQLERPRALELSAHVEGCADCQALLRALERESRWLGQALVEEEESVPARLLAPPAREAMPWAWIVSFGLASAGAYTLWTGVVEPWRQQLSQAGFGESNLLTMLFFGGVFWKGWESMANTLQFLALTTLGFLVYSLLRRRLRRWTTIALVLGALGFALALPREAGAAEIHKGPQTYTLPVGEVVKNDLILMTGTARIDGTVDGDLIVFCQSLTINGRVTGDVLAFSRLLRINGPVDGNVRAFINTAELDSTVGKNVTVFVETFDLDPKAQVGGSLTGFIATASLDGRIGRDLLIRAGQAQVNGFVGGNAQMGGDRFSIGSTAEIQGKATFRGRRWPNVAPGAKLASPLQVEIVKHLPDYASPRFYWRQALKWGAAFLFGIVVVLLLPGFFAETVRASRRYGPSLGFGALVLFATPILAIIACVTIVGLALGIGTLLLWVLALYSAQLFVGAWLGESLLGAPVGTGAVLGRLAFGLLLITTVGAMPYIGGWVKFFVLIWGLGALTLAVYNRMRTQPPPAPTGSEQAA